MPKRTNADDLRVERIAAQLEEAVQQRLTDYWIEEATRANKMTNPTTPQIAERVAGAKDQSWVGDEVCGRRRRRLHTRADDL